MTTNLILNTWLAMAGGSAQGSGVEGQQPFYVSMFPILLIMVMVYFMLLRPTQKKAKEAEALVKSAKTGDQVVAAGGIMGMISNVKENSVILKVADNVKIEVLKSSIVSVTKSGSDTTSSS